MIDRYWSETMPFRTVPVTTVEPTRPARVRVSGRRIRARSSIIPLDFMQPPKHIAQRIRNTVFSMPSMPRLVTSGFTSGLPVSIETVS